MASTIEQNIDLNSLFNLNYNFDILKSVIENIFIANKSTNQKIKDFADKLEKKDEIIAK